MKITAEADRGHRAMRTRARIILSAGVVVLLVACGGSKTPTTSSEVPCDQVRWGFLVTNVDGSTWEGVSLRPGQSIKETLSAHWMSPEGRMVAGVCDDRVSDLSWESSDSSVASVKAVSNRSAIVTAQAAGTADITCRFLLMRVTRTSTYIRITVRS